MNINNPIELLCSHWGMSLSHIARLLKLPQSAVRGWRKNDTFEPPQESLTHLVQLNAFLADAVALGVEDAASWLERDLVKGYVVCGMDLYEEGERDTLMRIMLGAEATEQLDWAMRDWRVRFVKTYDVFYGDDDYPSVRARR